MERLKNFLFDIGDSLIIIVVFSLMMGIVIFKLNDTLPIDETILGETAQSSDVEQPDIINAEAGENTQETSVSSEQITAPKPEEEQIETNTNDDNQERETTTASENENGEIVVEIPMGASAYSIAELLHDQNVIKDEAEFLNMIEDSGLSSKLRAGTYTFKKNMTLEEVVEKFN